MICAYFFFFYLFFLDNQYVEAPFPLLPECTIETVSIWVAKSISGVDHILPELFHSCLVIFYCFSHYSALN